MAFAQMHFASWNSFDSLCKMVFAQMHFASWNSFDGLCKMAFAQMHFASFNLPCWLPDVHIWHLTLNRPPLVNSRERHDKDIEREHLATYKT